MRAGAGLGEVKGSGLSCAHSQETRNDVLNGKSLFTTRDFSHVKEWLKKVIQKKEKNVTGVVVGIISQIIINHMINYLCMAMSQNNPAILIYIYIYHSHGILYKLVYHIISCAMLMV